MSKYTYMLQYSLTFFTLNTHMHMYTYIHSYMNTLSFENKTGDCSVPSKFEAELGVVHVVNLDSDDLFANYLVTKQTSQSFSVHMFIYAVRLCVCVFVCLCVFVCGMMMLSLPVKCCVLVRDYQ